MEGRCPECGLDIWPSIIHMIDPTASKLPQLRDPRGVGNALVWLFICALLATALLAVSGMMLMLNLLPLNGLVGAVLHVPIDLPLLSGVAALASLWSVWKFMPPRGEPSEAAIRRDVWILALAMIGWAIVAFGLWERERTWARMGLLPDSDLVLELRALAHVAIAIAAMFALHSIRGVLQTIGVRSREYRRAQGSRQGIKPMMVAALGVVIGSLCRYSGTMGAVPGIVPNIGLILVLVSMVMLLIGLGYLLVNAWWIRRVLRKPPPRLRDLLQPVPERRSVAE